MNVGEVGKRLLAQPALGAEPSDIRAKACANVHRWEVQGVSTNGLQTMSDMRR